MSQPDKCQYFKWDWSGSIAEWYNVSFVSAYCENVSRCLLHIVSPSTPPFGGSVTHLIDVIKYIGDKTSVGVYITICVDITAAAVIGHEKVKSYNPGFSFSWLECLVVCQCHCHGNIYRLYGYSAFDWRPSRVDCGPVFWWRGACIHRKPVWHPVN